MPCRHADIRVFDGLRYCLACGEAVFEQRQPQPKLTLPSSGESAEYVHDPLQIGLGLEIRLIVLLPGEYSDPVRCHIIHVLLGATKFEAVSYTWATERGDDTKSKTIYIGSQQSMHVTINCKHALRQLRRAHAKRYLWIDAICINQADANERSHQVGIMDRIFSAANCVLMSIPYIAPRDLLPEKLSRNIPKERSVSPASLFLWLNEPSDKVFSRHKAEIEKALTVLLRSRYFQRAWVLQEIALAKRLILNYGTYEAEIYFPVLEHIRQRFSTPPALNWNPGLVRQSDVISCLQAGFRCQATDPRDRIFAVLSLMEPRTRSLIPADYTLSIEDVYRYALLAVVVESQCLDILVYIALECTKVDVGLGASLISTQFEDFVVNHENYMRQPTNKSCTADERWKAHVEIKAWQESNDDKKTKSKSYANSCLVTTSTSNSLCESYVAMPGELSDDPQSGVMLRFHVRAHFIDTIVRHRDYYEYKYEIALNAERFGILCPLWLLKYFSLSSELDDSHLRRSGTLSIPNDIGHDTNKSDILQFHQSWIDTPYRELFETHYSVGHVPHVSLEMENSRVNFCPGDAIFAIDGISTPLILRQTIDGYKIVSSCYLWAALELDYWNPGTKKGRWGTRHHDHGCEQTQMITIV